MLVSLLVSEAVKSLQLTMFRCLFKSFVGLCICLMFGVGLIGALIMSLVVDATYKFEEAAKICFGLCSCALIALITVGVVLFCIVHCIVH